MAPTIFFSYFQDIFCMISTRTHKPEMHVHFRHLIVQLKVVCQTTKCQMVILVKVYNLFTISHLLSIDIFVSVSLVRENVRRLRENLKHKIQTYG